MSNTPGGRSQPPRDRTGRSAQREFSNIWQDPRTARGSGLRERDQRPVHVQIADADEQDASSLMTRSAATNRSGRSHTGPAIGFRESLALRNYRADLLKIREKFHTYTSTKFKNVRELFGALDVDKDGKISIQDWRQGLKDVNFPISESDAVKMFRAIDIDNDNGLSYAEVVSVLEPPTLTSVSMNSKHEKKQLEALAGFLSFTQSQAEVAHSDPDGKLLAAALRHEALRQQGRDAEKSMEPGAVPHDGREYGTGAVVRAPVMTKHEKAVKRVEERAKLVDPTPWVLAAQKQKFASRCPCCELHVRMCGCSRSLWLCGVYGACVRAHKLEDIRQRVGICVCACCPAVPCGW